VGIGAGAPTYAHLPLVTGDGNRKLSKRDPQSNLFLYRDRGFVPEGLLNYLALLGWSLPAGPGSADRDVFTLAEMVEAFDVTKVSANTARFDIKKAEAINSAHLRMLTPDDFARRLEPYVVAELSGTAPVMTDTLDGEQRPLLVAAAPLVQERSTVLSDAALMLRFLFVPDAAFAVDDDAAAKNLGTDAAPVLEAALTSLDKVGDWSATEIEAALKGALVDGLGLKPRKAFGPVRVAVTGRTVSPPLYESMELLGRERSLERLRAGFERAGAVG
jgi:glutamyl-tRNA synthetase